MITLALGSFALNLGETYQSSPTSPAPGRKQSTDPRPGASSNARSAAAAAARSSASRSPRTTPGIMPEDSTDQIKEMHGDLQSRLAGLRSLQQQQTRSTERVRKKGQKRL